MPMKNRNLWFPKAALITVLLLVSALSGQSQSDEFRSGQWRIAGQNLSNSWSQPTEHSISPANVKGLTPKWVFTTGGDVSATPTVDGDAVYFPDWGGNLFAVEKNSGRLIWSHKISDYDGVDGAISRVSPAVDGNQVIIGDILNGKQVHNGANVISVDRESGTLRWMTKVDNHPAAIITGSPVVFDGVVYVGVSSSEEGLATDPTYPCCSFRGSVVALDVKTGAMLWKTFDMPDNGGKPGGYSGGAVWQPPAIDPHRGTLFVGTGNNYTAPASVEACGHSIQITATSFGARRSGPAVRSAASSGVRQPTVSGFMSLSGIVTICLTPWCPRGSRSPGVHGALLMLPLDTSFGRPRIPLPGLPIPARSASQTTSCMRALIQGRCTRWTREPDGSSGTSRAGAQ